MSKFGWRQQLEIWKKTRYSILCINMLKEKLRYSKLR